MALVCLCRGNFYWPPHTTILFCSIFLDKIVLDTLKSRYHRSAPLGIGNFYSETTIVAAITSRRGKNKLPTHVPIFCYGLVQNSFVLLEQVRTIDRRRIREYIGHLSAADILRVDRAAVISLGINIQL